MNVWVYVVLGLFAVLGRFVGTALGAAKELANRLRQYRVERLASAWRCIVLATSDATEVSRRDLEGALRDVQLFGTPPQVDRATKFVQGLETGVSLTPVLVELLEALRCHLRRELHLSHQVTPLAASPGGTPSPAREPAASVAMMRPLRPPLSLVRTHPHQARGHHYCRRGLA